MLRDRGREEMLREGEREKGERDVEGGRRQRNDSKYKNCRDRSLHHQISRLESTTGTK